MAITDDQLGKALWEGAKAQALGTYNLAGPGQNQVELNTQKELLLWNTEAKGWTPEKEAALLAEGKTAAQVALDHKYPHRRKLIESGPRALDKGEQFKYAEKMAKKADPTWQRPMPKGAMPPAVGVPQYTDTANVRTLEGSASPIESMVAPPDLSVIGG